MSEPPAISARSQAEARDHMKLIRDCQLRRARWFDGAIDTILCRDGAQAFPRLVRSIAINDGRSQLLEAGMGAKSRRDRALTQQTTARQRHHTRSVYQLSSIRPSMTITLHRTPLCTPYCVQSNRQCDRIQLRESVICRLVVSCPFGAPEPVLTGGLMPPRSAVIKSAPSAP